MIAQILPNALELVANLDADALEPFWLADAGQFQKLWRIDRTGADDDLPVGAGFMLLAVYIGAHADAAVSLDQQAFGHRLVLDRQVLPPPRRHPTACRGPQPSTTALRRFLPPYT